MKKLAKKFVGRLWAANHGQDLIEYALMAGFVAVAAGVIMPTVSESIVVIFTKIQKSICISNADGNEQAVMACEEAFECRLVDLKKVSR